MDGDHRLNDALPKIELLFEMFLMRVARGQSGLLDYHVHQ